MLGFLKSAVGNLTSGLRDFPAEVGEKCHTRCDVRGWALHEGTVKVCDECVSHVTLTTADWNFCSSTSGNL